MWGTREDFDRFVVDRLIPAQKEVMGEEAWNEMTSAAADLETDVVAGMEIVEAPVHRYFSP